MPINSFMTWIGGKKALREEIIERFPLEYERYVEVFGGAGWVYFGKAPGKFEVFNDYNALLVNLYRCVREQPQELLERLRYVLNSREDFKQVKTACSRDSPASDVQLAAWFYQLIRYSYASGLTSFGATPHDIWSDFPIIQEAHRRLGGTVIENKDFQHLIRQYDRPATFFYCDPPYYGTEDYYQNIGKQGFAQEDHIRLRDTLKNIEGRFMLSYNDCPEIRRLYEGWADIEEVERLDNIKQRYDNGAMYKELLIANYSMSARALTAPKQLTLFGGPT